MVGAWRELTGRPPAKANFKFHGLLLAASASICEHPAEEQNLEWATKMAWNASQRVRQAGVNERQLSFH
jgi:hypothetical protein